MAERPAAPSAPYVVVSDLAVEVRGAAALEQAFTARLREVEEHPGFQRLEVWRDDHEAGAYRMVTWWDDEASFRSYMRSPAHRRSHARIPQDPVRARPVTLRRYTVIAT